MRRYLLSVVYFIAFVCSLQFVAAQTIEMQILTTAGTMGNVNNPNSPCVACGNNTPNPKTRLRYVFGGNTTDQAGYDHGTIGCAAYNSTGPVGTNPITSSTQAYGTTATIQLSAQDTRSCPLGTIAMGNADGGTQTVNPTGISPGGTYSATQTTTRAGGNTSFAGMQWQYRWRYVSAGPAGTITSPSGTSFCNSASNITLDGSDLTSSYQGVQYEWRYSLDGYASVLGTAEDLSVADITSTRTFRRIAKYRNNYDNGSPTFATSQVDITITISKPPTATGFDPNPGTFCSGTPVSVAITGWNAGTGTPTITAIDNVTLDTVYSGTSPTITFTAPSGISNRTYNVYATAPSPCTSPVTLGVFSLNYTQNSTAPTSIDVTPATTICKGTPVTLTAKGAKLGTGARYEWSIDNFTTIADSSYTDSTYTVTPGSTTTYSVRVGNTATPCPATTGSISQVITVIDSTVPPSSITASQSFYCAGDPNPVVLTQSGGSLGTGANWQWSDVADFSNVIGTGASINVFPTTTTTYYVRGVNNAAPCAPTSAAASTTITYKTLSVAPDSISSSTNGICNGSSVTLTVQGGSLGTGAVWTWYSGSCGGTFVDTGAVITVSPLADVTYYVRAEGDCNNTACVNKFIKVFQPAVNPTSVAFPDVICYDNTTTIDLTVTGGTLGTGMDWYWYADSLFIPNTEIATGATITGLDPTLYPAVWVRGENTGLFGPIPPPCPSVTDSVKADLTGIVYEVTLSAPNPPTIDVDLFCDSGTSVITVTGDISGFTYDYVSNNFDQIDPSPYAFFMLYDEDPTNPGATPIDSNQTGSFTVFSDSTTTYYVTIKNTCDETTAESITVTVNYSSVAPTGITRSQDSICNGFATNVTITATGGTLGTNAVYEFSDQSDFSNVLYSGPNNFIIVSPTVTTTYYAHIINTALPCVDVSSTVQSIEVVVTDSSIPPTQITSSADSICNGSSATLTANGTLGTDAFYEWSDDNFATIISGQITNTITVSPTSTTTYSVRINGPAPCSYPTASASFLLTVTEPSVAPTSLTVSQDSICDGFNTPVTLTAVGGTLGTDAVYEFSDAADFSNIIASGVSNTTVVSPTVTTTYYVRINGPAPCTYPTSSQSVLLTVTDSSIAPTQITSSADSICNGSSATLTANGTLGTDAFYEWSDDNFATIIPGQITNTITVSPTSTTTYSVRINGPAPCSYPTTSASFLLTVTEPSVAPTSVTATSDTICEGGSVTLTAVGGTLGTGAQYEWSTDNFASTIPGENNSTLVVTGLASTTTYSVRINGPAPCSYPTSVVSKTIQVNDTSIAPTSIDTSGVGFPCYGDIITLTQVGGTLGTGAVWQWATDAGFTNVLGTTVSNSFNTSITQATTYYVRAINGLCPPNPTAAASISINLVQAILSTNQPLAGSTVVTTECPINDNNWHYFIDGNGDVVAAINSNGQNIGLVTFEVTVGDNGPFVNANNQVCINEQEYYVARYYRVETQFDPASPVSFRLFITPAEYTAHKNISDAQSPQYKSCWGTTVTAADLQLTAFFDEDGGNPGEAIEVSERVFTANGGPNNSHQYEFSLDPNSPRLNPYGRFDNDGTTIYLHNSGGKSSLLPVELTSFTATYTNDAVLLNWETASEVNNDRFEVLRSTDGVNFTQIGTVAGNGTTSQPQAYSLLDRDVKPGLYYYRLRQVDFDGISELSRIVSVLVPGAAKFDVGNFFPNPTRNLTSINITLPQETRMVFTLYSIDGKIMFSDVYNLGNGNQRIDVDVAKLPAGSYIGIFQTDSETINRKLIKQE
jgi:hypothetical protein